MAIFPSIPIPDTVKQANSKPTSYGKELAFDFKAEGFIFIDGSPQVLEGIDALKVWIEKAIRTARFRCAIYDDNYGCELEEIIGLDIPSPILDLEIQRAIREALIYDNRIKDVGDFAISRNSSRLSIEFSVTTFDDNAFSQEVSL